VLKEANAAFDVAIQALDSVKRVNSIKRLYR
jgi:hypothetical protein